MNWTVANAVGANANSNSSEDVHVNVNEKSGAGAVGVEEVARCPECGAVSPRHVP